MRLVNTSNQESFDLVLPNTDLRRAAAGEKLILSILSILSGTVPLPTEMSTGTYALWLGSPDPSEKLRQKPEYALRFANSDDHQKSIAWYGKQGFMSLGMTINIL